MISVIVPTWNEEKYISKCIQGLKAQTFRDFEVIIVDGKSSDNTVETIKRISDYKVILSNDRGAPQQRNFGAKNARGDIMVFTDADTVLSPNALEEINSILQKKDYVVGGSITGAFEPINYKIKFLNFINKYIQRALKLTYAYCIFARKNAFENANGFKSCICEDSEFGSRLRKYGELVILENCSYLSSSRRFIEMGFYTSVFVWVLEYFKNKFGIYTPIETYPVFR